MRLATVLVVIGTLIVLNGCEAGCASEVASIIESPRGGHVAVVFNRNCGATTGFNTQLSILAKGNAVPRDAGNALIADGSLSLGVRWVSESQLVVSGHQGAKLFKQEKSVNGIAVSYE
jgi:hypothetical protein